eukprot:6262706-Pyramimonas_sp.AAC.1
MFNGERMTRSFWADNLLLYAKTRTDLELMVRDMSIPLMNARMTWKPKSLMYIYFGAPPGTPPSPEQDIRVL